MNRSRALASRSRVYPGGAASRLVAPPPRTIPLTSTAASLPLCGGLDALSGDTAPVSASGGAAAGSSLAADGMPGLLQRTADALDQVVHLFELDVGLTATHTGGEQLLPLVAFERAL